MKFKSGDYVTFKSEREFNERFECHTYKEQIKKHNKWTDTYRIDRTYRTGVFIKMKGMNYCTDIHVSRLTLVSKAPILTSRRTK